MAYYIEVSIFCISVIHYTYIFGHTAQPTPVTSQELTVKKKKSMPTYLDLLSRVPNAYRKFLPVHGLFLLPMNKTM